MHIHPGPSVAAAARLLEAAGLPSSDLTDGHMAHFFHCGSADAPSGLVGVELSGDTGLLRSLVVAPDRRRGGMGAALVEHAADYARSRGARTLYLLTDSAAEFFAARGFRRVPRDTAPESIRATREFASLCPASAAFMARPLGQPSNVLILCTGNSARSILGEALINHWGRGRFVGNSAGSAPKGQVHPIALALLKQMNLRTDGLRSKSWDEFARPGAPRIDFVITVCDNAAAETCPAWPGQPVKAHWGIADPAAVSGSEADQWRAFRIAFAELEIRIKAFVGHE